MSLKNRIKLFDDITSNLECSRPSPLILSYKIPDNDWEHMKHTAAVYMSKCIPGNPLILDEEELLQTFHEKQKEILNVTPNGMIVSKRHTVLEYNSMIQAFAKVINGLGIADDTNKEAGFLD